MAEMQERNGKGLMSKKTRSACILYAGNWNPPRLPSCGNGERRPAPAPAHVPIQSRATPSPCRHGRVDQLRRTYSPSLPGKKRGIGRTCQSMVVVRCWWQRQTNGESTETRNQRLQINSTRCVCSRTRRLEDRGSKYGVHRRLLPVLTRPSSSASTSFLSTSISLSRSASVSLLLRWRCCLSLSASLE